MNEMKNDNKFLYCIYSDGASKINPGYAACGFVIKLNNEIV